MSKVKAFTGPTYRYNPSFKPTSLTPGVPVLYYGFPPHAGWTYSSVECEACSNPSLVTSAHNKFCPGCGSKVMASSLDEVSADKQQEIQCAIEHTCNGCGAHTVTAFKNLGDKVHCTGCGNQYEDSVLSSIQSQLKEKAMSQNAKAALLKVIAGLKERGEHALAADLEKEMQAKEEQQKDEAQAANPDAKVAALDSGVDQKIPTGNKEEDAKEMIDEEKVNPTPVEEQSQEDEAVKIALSQVQDFAHFGIPAFIKADLTVVAADEVELEEEKAEDDMNKDEVKIVPLATAEAIVAYNKRNGIATQVTRVESGYVLTAMPEEIQEEDAQEMGDEQLKDVVEEQAETVLPEDKSTIDETVKAEDEELKEEKALDEKEAEKAVAALHKAGKKATITRTEAGFVVAEEQLDTKLPEEKAKDDEVKAEEPAIMDEHMATAKAQILAASGKAAKITKVSENGYTVAEIAPEEIHEDVEDKVEEIQQEAKEDSKDVIETLSVDEQKDELKAYDGKEEEMQAAAEQEILEEQKAADEAVEDVKKEEDACDDKEMAMATLSPVETLVVASEEDVMMILSEVNDQPFYSVLVKGEPVAKIELAAQPKPEQIAEFFQTEAYAMELVDAMKKQGVKATLQAVNAKFYANEIVSANAQEKIAASMKDSMDKQYAEAVASVRDDMADRLALEIAASNKNFYKDSPHHLKAALYETILAEVDQEGRISETGIVAAIENGFSNGAGPFFGQLLDRAIAKLDMPKEALAELKKAIGEANVQALEYVEAEDEQSDSEEDDKEPKQTYASRLSQKNVPVTSQIDRETIRQKLHFRK